MKRIRENLKYMFSKEDSDKVKYEKILNKMEELSLSLHCKNYKIISITDGYIHGEALLVFEKLIDESEREEIILPFVFEVSKFNVTLNKTISEIKKFLIFEKLGILTNELECIATYEKSEKNSQDFATENQLKFIFDKCSKIETRNLIEIKLKEYGKSVDNLTKFEASGIITSLGRK